MFCNTLPLPPALTFFLPSVLRCFLSLGGGDIDIPFVTEHSTVIYFHYFDQFRYFFSV